MYFWQARACPLLFSLPFSWPTKAIAAISIVDRDFINLGSMGSPLGTFALGCRFKGAGFFVTVVVPDNDCPSGLLESFSKFSAMRFDGDAFFSTFLPKINCREGV